MTLTVLNSSSKANGYVLQSDVNGEALIIECGCPVTEALQAVGFASAKIQGCLLTHEHSDHARHAEKYMQYMPLYTSCGTDSALTYRGPRRPHTLQEFQIIHLGSFTVQPFSVRHDAAQPFGYLIDHPESGRILFATDTYFLDFTFEHLNQIILECNYIPEILEENVRNGTIHPAMMRRTLRAHQSLRTTLLTLRANNLRHVNHIILIHLSSTNSDPQRMLSEVQLATRRRVTIATKGLKLNIDKTL